MAKIVPFWGKIVPFSPFFVPWHFLQIPYLRAPSTFREQKNNYYIYFTCRKKKILHTRARARIYISWENFCSFVPSGGFRRDAKTRKPLLHEGLRVMTTHARRSRVEQFQPFWNNFRPKRNNFRPKRNNFLFRGMPHNARIVRIQKSCSPQLFHIPDFIKQS